MTGDDRVRGSLGKDVLDGGKDWYAIKEDGDKVYHLEYLNAYEAEQRDLDGDVLDIKLVLQTEDGHGLIQATDESDEEAYEAYFDDTLIYHQDDFTVGVSRFTITLNDYLGLGEEIEFNHGGAGTVGVDANGDGTVEVANVSAFTNFENIRTVSGTGLAVAGTNGGQGRDTLNIQELSDDSDVGVRYNLTGDDGAGQVTLLEDLEFVDLDDDDEDDEVIDHTRVVIKVDGVENVVFGDGDDELWIDETEAAKDNDIVGDDGYDFVTYFNDFPAEDVEGDDEPTVTIEVGSAHVEGSSGSLDKVMMTEGRVGSVVATDTLHGVEEITLLGNTAAGVREDDVLNVEKLTAGASVSYVTGEIFSDTDGDLDFEDGVLQLTVNNLEEVEFVIADGKDAVIVADSDIMEDNARTDGEDDLADLTINSFLNYDLLDERDDAPTRLTIAELRAIDGGTDDTADEDDIPEGYNFAQFNFQLGQDTDTVDYSQTTDAINAIIDLSLDDDPQYIMVDSDGGDFDGVGEFDGGEDDPAGDRVDALLDVEQVVASQGESVLDFTASDMDVEITFQYLIDADVVLDADDGYSETNAVRIADGSGDTIEGLTSFIERYTAEDGDVTNATWSRIEGSDNDETVIYEGSENLVDQSNVDHRFSNDELNLRGGDNTVSYSPLETSIAAQIDMTAFDAALPPANAVGTDPAGLEQHRRRRRSFAEPGEFAGPGLAGGGMHSITSYSSDNPVSAGSLKLEASQDAEDSVTFNFDEDKVYVLGQSPGVISVSIGSAATMVLTGFEVLRDWGGSDDIYTIEDLDDVVGDLFLVDDLYSDAPGDADRDTLKITDEEAINYNNGAATFSNEVDTVKLESFNDAFGFDFSILDISELNDNDLRFVRGDDDDQDSKSAPDAFLNAADTDYEGPADRGGLNAIFDPTTDGAADSARDLDDEVVLGDLDSIEEVTLFSSIQFTDASIASSGSEFTLDTDLDELSDDGGDLLFATDTAGLNFSRLTGAAGVTVNVVGALDDVEIIGSKNADNIAGEAGDDIIRGGAGNDTLSGGVEPEDVEILTFGFNSGGQLGSTFATVSDYIEITDGTGYIRLYADGSIEGDDGTNPAVTIVANTADDIPVSANQDVVGNAIANVANVHWATYLPEFEIADVSYTNYTLFVHLCLRGKRCVSSSDLDDDGGGCWCSRYPGSEHDRCRWQRCECGSGPGLRSGSQQRRHFRVRGQRLCQRYRYD